MKLKWICLSRTYKTFSVFILSYSRSYKTDTKQINLFLKRSIKSLFFFPWFLVQSWVKFCNIDLYFFLLYLLFMCCKQIQTRYSSFSQASTCFVGFNFFFSGICYLLVLNKYKSSTQTLKSQLILPALFFSALQSLVKSPMDVCLLYFNVVGTRPSVYQLILCQDPHKNWDYYRRSLSSS